jgi:hypothetical protein
MLGTKSSGERTRPACGFRRRAENGVARGLAHERGLGATPKPARGTRALPGREMLPPRRNGEFFGLGFYKDVAPMALGQNTFHFKRLS